MDKNQYGFVLIISVIIVLGLVSFSSCLACEFKKAKRKDLKLNEKLCYMPQSQAFRLGIAALLCLFVAQIIGNLFICSNLYWRGKKTSLKAKKPTIASTSLLLSWISFGIAVVLVSAATSMNTSQPYGEGWLENECYIVKDGVYFGSAILVLLAIGSIVVLAITTIMKNPVEQDQKLHAQVGRIYGATKIT